MKEWLSFSDCQLMHDGGEAFVYRAKYKKKETVALKVYKEGLRFNQDFYVTLKKNKHPNTALILDYGFCSGCFWTCSEYIQGIRSSSVAPFSVSTALHLLRGVVSGLSFLENVGFSHGDLAPDNILITKEGRAVIIDGGIQGVGHLYYASPERFEKAEPTIKSDLFSLGILLYYWLTATVPYEHRNYDSLVEEILHIESSKISTLLHLQNFLTIEEIAALDPIWRGLIQVNPEDRFSSFEELEEHLEIALLHLGKQAVFLEKPYKKWLLFLQNKIIEQESDLDQKKVEYPKGISKMAIIKSSSITSIWPIFLKGFLLLCFFFFIFFFFFNHEKESQNVLETGEQMLERVRSKEILLESKPDMKGVAIENAPRPIDVLNKDSL